MTRVLQISDPHIMPEGALFQGSIDSNAALAGMLAGLKDMLPRIAPVARLVISGDLSDTGCADSYRNFMRIMQDAPLPWCAIPGNHDNRAAMRAAMRDAAWMPQEGPIRWREDLEDLTLLGLDTLVEGEAGGELDGDDLDWLAGMLSELQDRAVLLFMHHPPIATGIPAMDGIALRAPGRLADAIADHRGDLQICCGHVHRMITAGLAGRPVVVAPGTSHAVGLDLRADAALRFVPGDVGAMLHESGPGGQGFRISRISPPDFTSGQAPV